MEKIATDSKWDWANKDVMKKPLQTSVDNLKKLDSAFARAFLNESVQTVKKSYADTVLVEALEDFKTNVSKLISIAELETQQLVRMHGSRRAT